jgi:GNAT superfamily N-acetyltransferase
MWAKASSFTARAADAPGIARLSAQLGYPATADEIATRLAPLLADPAHHGVLVVDGDDGIAGWLHVLRIAHLELPPHAEIAALVVDAAHRNARLGERLVAAAADWARERALGQLRVRSNTVRTEAHRFYQRLGFMPEKTQAVLTRPVP